MISYAQNHEDVVLARAFSGPSGFYIDVGAASPVIHSVTKYFYDRGWSGINIEPVERWHEELSRERTRDVNLCVGLSDAQGELEFFDVADEAGDESTFSPEIAAELGSRGLKPNVRQVHVTTLADVCEAHVSGPIDFLKIDVEGWELRVLEGGAWDRFRPIAVAVESTEPGTLRPIVERIDRFMAGVDYVFALFDGLNRFYVRKEDERLVDVIGIPANVTDRFETAEAVRLRESVVAAETAIVAAETALKDEARRAEELALRIATAERQRVLAEKEVMAARREAQDAEIQFHATRDALQRLLTEQPGL
jgi:FkbM family methyltransferase